MLAGPEGDALTALMRAVYTHNMDTYRRAANVLAASDAEAEALARLLETGASRQAVLSARLDLKQALENVALHASHLHVYGRGTRRPTLPPDADADAYAVPSISMSKRSQMPAIAATAPLQLLALEPQHVRVVRDSSTYLLGAGSRSLLTKSLAVRLIHQLFFGL